MVNDKGCAVPGAVHIGPYDWSGRRATVAVGELTGFGLVARGRNNHVEALADSQQQCDWRLCS
jgi:hypothetical protein